MPPTKYSAGSDRIIKTPSKTIPACTTLFKIIMARRRTGLPKVMIVPHTI